MPCQNPRNPAGAHIQAGVLGTQREHGTRIEQSFYWSRREPAHKEIRKENQLESAGGRVFSLNQSFDTSCVNTFEHDTNEMVVDTEYMLNVTHSSLLLCALFLIKLES